MKITQQQKIAQGFARGQCPCGVVLRERKAAQQNGGQVDQRGGQSKASNRCVIERIGAGGSSTSAKVCSCFVSKCQTSTF